MSRVVAALASLMVVTTAAPALAERLTVALSTPEITISSNFTGTTVTVFGVIERDAQSVSRVGGYGIGVLLLGPSETVVARRKEPFFGIWVNATSKTFEGAPSFYSLNTSVAVDKLATTEVLDRLQLGFDHIDFHFEKPAPSSDSEDFQSAFVRLKSHAGLYHQGVGVSFIGDLIFRTTFYLPANIPVGAYTTEAYLFSGQSLVGRADDHLRVSKSGLEDTMSTFAHNQALLYGLICVALALFTGWLAGVIFRRD